jgi:sigma-B regulation protein RsbU (phosphoserine phosphatase)
VPLGFFPDTSYDELAFELHRDDLFVFYTDGILDSVDGRGVEFGAERLRQVIADHRTASPRDIIDAIFNAVAAFRGTHTQPDDMTAVAVKITA